MKFQYTPHYKNVGKDYYTIFVTLDKEDDFDTHHEGYHLHSKKLVSDLKKLLKRLAATLDTVNANHFILHLSNSIINLNDTHMMQHIIWKFLKKFLPWQHGPETTIIVTHEDRKEYPHIRDFVALSEKIRDARLLAMAPANLGYPDLIVKHFKNDVFSKIPRTRVNIMNHETLKKQGFNLILAVGDSAVNKPRLLVVERLAIKKGAKTICIVGKGITFDTGGLSVKGFRDMLDMKFDKTGAVYGGYALAHLLEDKTYENIHFVGIFPYAENAISGSAAHPGDVIKSYLGKTVEISDPDAEGRLVLADAFGYSHKFKPDLIIDIATLTGHAESINCWHNGYYYAVPESLRTAVEKLSYEIGDPMLPMPTWDDHDDILESPVADLVNSPNKCEDAFVATLFMKQFIPVGADWCHIDLSHEFDDHVPQGNGIRTIVETVRWWIDNHKK
jgi:leucyl aminopeptidase